MLKKKLTLICTAMLAAWGVWSQCQSGDPSVIPVGSWNAYVYNDGDNAGGGGAWSTGYAGYYSFPDLNINVQTGEPTSNSGSWFTTWVNQTGYEVEWTGSPSEAPNYQGCTVDTTSFSIWFRRQGVPECGNYTIDIQKGQTAWLKIDGVVVWSESESVSDYELNQEAWSGYLDFNSVLEYGFSSLSNYSSRQSGLIFKRNNNPAFVICDDLITMNKANFGNRNIFNHSFYSSALGMNLNGNAVYYGANQVLRLTQGFGHLGTASFVPSVTLKAFVANFDMKIPTTSLANGVSFNYGNFNPAVGGGEGGFSSGLSVCFRTIAIPDIIELKWNGTVLASTNLDVSHNFFYETTVEVSDDGKVTLKYGENQSVLFNQVQLPGYTTTDKTNWKIAFSGKTAGLSNDIHAIDDINIYATDHQEFSLDGNTWQSSNVFTTVPDGPYSFSIRNTDNPGCIVTQNVNVPFALSSIGGSVDAVNCSFNSTGVDGIGYGGYYFSNYSCNTNFSVTETFINGGVTENIANYTLAGLSNGVYYRPQRVWSVGTTTVNVSVSDGLGNNKTTSYSVFVNDPTSTAIQAPADVIFCISDALMPLGNPSYDPGCGATVTNDAPISGFSIGQTTVTWTITYTDGDVATDTQIVTVNDVTVYYVDADGDGYGAGSGSNYCSYPGTGFVTNSTDCNDANAFLSSITDEICDGLDNDCNGVIDNGLAFFDYFVDADSDGFGAGIVNHLCVNPGSGYVTNNTDCNDSDALLSSITDEFCDGFDNDCNGIIDNGLTFTNYFIDADGDGYGTGSVNSLCANPGSGYATNNSDCNDIDVNTNPVVNEICGNNIDEDCNGYDLVCATLGIEGAIAITNIGNYNSGIQSSVSVSFEGATNTIENPGNGNDIWFHFTAGSNAIRIALSGSSNAIDDNDISLFSTPQINGVELIPLVIENDVTIGSEGISSDAGNEILLYDGLTIGEEYFIAVRNLNQSNGNVQLKIAYLRSSQNDILPYTNYTGVYANTCQNYKAKFRNGAAGYVVNRFNSIESFFNDSLPNWTFALPFTNGIGTASTVCQLGKIIPPNVTGQTISYFINVDVIYILKDAFGNSSTLTAQGGVPQELLLNSEAPLTVRSADQCPAYKSLSSAIATNRSVCGTTVYGWQLTEVLPTAGLPVVVNGPSNGGRILNMSSFPSLGSGKTYDVRVRAHHLDNVSVSAYGPNACVRTIGTAGMVPWSNDQEVMSPQSNFGALVYPNPSNGNELNIYAPNLEGSVEVIIRDARGLLLSKQSFAHWNGASNVMDVPNHWASGIYFIEIFGNGQEHRMRWILNK